jgi:hypothetical protein
MNGGWLGGIYSPNHQTSHLVKAAVAWRTGQSGAPATSSSRWILTVGASVFWATGQSGGAPDRSCRLSGAPSGACLTSARTVAHLMVLQGTVGAEVVVAPLAHRTVWCATGHCPVLHRTVRWIIVERLPRIPEGEQFGVGVPGAPDSPVRQTRAHFGWLLLSIFESFFGLFIGLFWTFGTCRFHNLEQTN